MDVNLNGLKILSEQDFHRALATAFGVQEVYGCNMDALWDLLSASVERPLRLIWNSHAYSKNGMGEDFYKIFEILERVKLQDENFGWKDRFSYLLE